MFIRSTRSSRTRYRPQTKFGARSCFYTCLSFCSHRGGGFPACITASQVTWPGGSASVGFCLGRGEGAASRAGGGLPPGGCIQSGRGSSSREVHPEREGVFLQEGLGRPRPPPNQVLRDTVNKRAVRIPLECILVVNLIQYTWKSECLY